MESREISLQDWLRVREIMWKHHRNEGYVDFVSGDRLEFFDSDPCINGVRAAYITLSQVNEIIRAKR